MSGQMLQYTCINTDNYRILEKRNLDNNTRLLREVYPSSRLYMHRSESMINPIPGEGSGIVYDPVHKVYYRPNNRIDNTHILPSRPVSKPFKGSRIVIDINEGEFTEIIDTAEGRDNDNPPSSRAHSARMLSTVSAKKQSGMHSSRSTRSRPPSASGYIHSMRQFSNYSPSMLP